MRVTSIKTDKLSPPIAEPLTKVLDSTISSFQEKSILVVTSKIVSICEGRVVKVGNIDKHALIEKESEFYLPASKSKYDLMLTIHNNLMVPSAGVDESNGNGYYILWPENPQKSANAIREYVMNRFAVTKVGVIITDSHTSPLRWGTTGVSIAFSGFEPLRNYIGSPDIFGRKLQMTKANVVDALAVSAVLVMGEGSEQTPLAVISDIPFVKFQNRNPTEEELGNLKIDIEDDVYAPVLTSVDWKKGKS